MSVEHKQRLTLSQIVREQFEELRSRRQERSSVKIGRGARGAIAIEVTVHAGDGDDARSIEDVAKKARKVFDDLCRKYPVEGAENGDGPSS